MPTAPTQPSDKDAVGTDTSTTGRHIPALDGIRGLAILLVFALHFLWGNSYSGHNPLIWACSRIRDLGWMGVDLFFVLSGFLITGILYDTLTSRRYFRNFYGRRVLRIFPLYYGLLLALLLISVLWHRPWNPITFALYGTFSNTLVDFPWHGLHLPSAPMLSLGRLELNHFWSLMIEEQFYFVWPLAVFLLRTRKRIAIVAMLVALASLTTRFCLAHSALIVDRPYILYSFTPSRLDGLALGAVVAMLVRSRWEHTVLRWGVWAAAAGFVTLFAMGLHWPHLDWVTYPNAAVWGFFVLDATFAAMLASALHRGSVAQRTFQSPVLRFFGRYSYGLYLLHVFFSDIALDWRLALRNHVHSPLLADVPPAIGGVALTVVAAMLCFHFYELPFLRLKRFFHNEAKRPRLEQALARDNAG